MKKSALTGLAALTLFDVAAQAQSPPPAIYNWTGYYVGINGGFRWAKVETLFPTIGFPSEFSANNGVVTGVFPLAYQTITTHPNTPVIGVHGGYNFQISATFLVGLEGDFDFGHGSASAFYAVSNPLNGSTGTFLLTTETTWSASLRARLGIVNDGWLFYGTGGIAFLGFKMAGSGQVNGSVTDVRLCERIGCDFDIDASAAGRFSMSKTLIGWTIGAGVERFWGNNWIIRIEYLYADFGRVNVGGGLPYGTLVTACSDSFGCATTPGGLAGNLSAEIITQTLRIGISKKF